MMNKSGMMAFKIRQAIIFTGGSEQSLCHLFLEEWKVKFPEKPIAFSIPRRMINKKKQCGGQSFEVVTFYAIFLFKTDLLIQYLFVSFEGLLLDLFE